MPVAGTCDSPRILVLGDSLSAGYNMELAQGWVQLLQQRLEQQGYEYTVVNASVSGETTGGALNRLPRALRLHQPALVIVELGGNDGLRGLPIDHIRENLQEIIAISTGSGARVVLCGIRIPPNYGVEYTDDFYQVFQDLGDQNAVFLVPFILQGVALEPDMMQADGIHPDSTAQPLLLDNTWPAIELALRSIAED